MRAYSQYVVFLRNCSFFNLGFTRTKVSNDNDDHVSTSKYCHEILGGFKKLSSDLTRVLHVLEKSYLNFALNVSFFYERN